LSEFPKNLAQVTGEVSRPPRVHQFGEGRLVVNLNVIVSDERDRRSYMNIVAFDDLGEQVKDVTEGSRVYAKGAVQKGKDWVGSDGEKRFGGIEVVADEIVVLGTRSGSDEPKKVEPKTKKKVEF